MGRNLPPGVSVSDLPGNRPGPEPPETCEIRGCPDRPSVEAMEDGYPLCGPHNEEVHRRAIDEERERRREEARREAEAKRRREEAERNAPLPDEPLPTPLVPREVAEEQERDT